MVPYADLIGDIIVSQFYKKSMWCGVNIMWCGCAHFYCMLITGLGQYTLVNADFTNHLLPQIFRDNTSPLGSDIRLLGGGWLAN